MASAADAFRRDRSTSTTIDGEVVFAVYRKKVHIGQQLRITRQQCSTERNQILNLMIDEPGELVTNDIAASAIALHSDRAPEQVDVLIRGPKGGLEEREPLHVMIWNGWTSDEIDHGWLGEAGLRVAGSDPLVLECREGFSDSDFTDLVVRIEVTGHADDDRAEETSAEEKASAEETGLGALFGAEQE